jgi:hypothetical protein
MRSRLMRKIIFFTSLFCMPLPLMAQGVDDLPCGDENNPFDTPCPLDNWVFMMALIFFIATTYRLYRKRKVS